MRTLFVFLFCAWAALVNAQNSQVLELDKGVSKAQLQLLNDLSARKRWLEQQSVQQAPIVAENVEKGELPSVVQMYLYMSPTDAANLLSGMPEDEAFDIFKQIPSYRSALILAKLPTELAQRWTLRLARQND